MEFILEIFLDLARKLSQALETDDDLTLTKILDDLHLRGYSRDFTFTTSESQRIAKAKQRIAALTIFRHRMTSNDLQQIVSAYDPILDGWSEITQDERQWLQLAKDFVQACQNHDYTQIIATNEAIHKANPCHIHGC